MPHGYNAQNKEGQQCQSGQHGGGYNRTKKLTRRARLVGLSRSNSRWHLFSTATAMFSVAFLVTFLCSSILAPARSTNAETVTESSSASGYTLSLSATPVVNLNVGVLEVPVMTVGVGTVSTSTTAPNGYKLYLSMAGTSNDLRRTGSDVDTISATTGTMADSSALGIGEWGYAIPSTTPNISTTDFDTSYDIMESAYPSSKGFAAPPISTATAELITSTSAPNTTADEFSVYYGVNADDTTPLGNYTGSVVWTAVADAGTTEKVTVSPSSVSANANTKTITVTTTLFSTGTVDADIYMLTSVQKTAVDGGTDISTYASSRMTCNKTSSAPLTYSCTVPNYATGSYYVYVNAPKYSKRYSTSFSYTAPAFYSLANMQDMTNAICSDVTTPIASATTSDSTGANSTSTSYVPTRTLKDTRDNNTYVVKKLADGRCWMTQNLRLKNYTLKASNSNVTSDGFVVPNAASGSSDDTSYVFDSGSTDYGVYYSWYAATAGAGTRSQTGDTSTSICPKGWRLPKGGSSGEFQTLYNNYRGTSGTETSTNMRNTSGPNLKLSGIRISSTMYYVGELGYYWSSTGYPSDSSRAYILYLSSSAVTPAPNEYKKYGFTIRCINAN